MICRKCHQEAVDAPYCCLCGTKQEVAQRASKKRGNGTGTAYKRGRTWTAQVTLYCNTMKDGVNEKRVRRYKTKGGFATKRDALAYIPTLLNSGEHKTPKLIDLWIRYEENSLPKLSASKQSAYNMARKRLDAIMGREIDKLTTAELQSTVNAAANSYYTARDMKLVLSHLYQLAMADQFVPANLSEHIILPELEEKEAVPFTPKEVDTMWEAFADGDTFVGYLLLMIYSGMMPGELFACEKDMIDFDRCEIWGCGKKTKKRKKEVPIVFAECVKPVLIELCETYEGDKIQPLSKNDWYDRYHEVVKKIGVRDLPPYSCRHTTGTEAARKNLNASTIQKIMRHAKISTSQRYIHLGAEEAHAGINTITSKDCKSPR